MVQLNEAFKTGFMQQYPATIVIANASGTEVGLRDLLDGKIDLAAMSRPLTPAEQGQGLVSVPVVTDAIALFVGKDNPFQGSLTQAQVRGIFQGTIQNWSEVGGPNIPLKVINRAPTSGTYQFFQEVVLQGQSFGVSPNITTLTLDETTPIIRSIGTDAISYASYSQIANQSTVRVVTIDGLSPTDANYPLQRVLYYVYRTPPSPSVQAFLGYVQSTQGKSALNSN
jgi:phosphate transport system substrate-binding protein